MLPFYCKASFLFWACLIWWFLWGSESRNHSSFLSLFSIWSHSLSSLYNPLFVWYISFPFWSHTTSWSRPSLSHTWNTETSHCISLPARVVSSSPPPSSPHTLHCLYAPFMLSICSIPCFSNLLHSHLHAYELDIALCNSIYVAPFFHN